MSHSLLHLMHMVSPALPVGAYAYSQGQEFAVEKGFITDADSAREWIRGVMMHSVAGLDLPVLIRLQRAWTQTDRERVLYWNSFLQACRESAEFELEDQQMGRALIRLLGALDIDAARHWPRQQAVCFATAFALAGVHWQVNEMDVLQGYCWSWLENQVAAATKLVPLGQTEAQQVLLALMDSVREAVECASALEDDEIGAGLPGLALLSAQHETQYSRLFRS